MKPLKLIALDSDDIDVVSAHLQDAVVRVGDLTFKPSQHRFVLAANRFDWEAPHRDAGVRRRTALRFDRVMAVRCRNLAQDRKDAVLNLLAVRFTETDAPAGAVELVFSGGACLRLEVECLECEIADLGPAWETLHVPAHETGAAEADPR